MLHREAQTNPVVEKNDIVRAKVYLKPIPGIMNSFSKSVEHKDFDGYAIVIHDSDSYCQLYFPNRSMKLFKKQNLVVVSKYKNKI
jgi:hypothetical protein